MNSVVTKLPQAKWDLIEIADWLAQVSEALADRFLTAVERSLAMIASMPGLGSLYLVDHPQLADIWVWPVKGFKRYLIFYRQTENGIEVLRVLHGARDIQAAAFD